MTRTNGPRASEQERKERRRAANRKSARKSRYRENVLMDELQKTVTDLAKHNQSLKSENDDFRQEILALQSLMACHAKAQQVVSSFQISSERLSIFAATVACCRRTTLNRSNALSKGVRAVMLECDTTAERLRLHLMPATYCTFSHIYYLFQLQKPKKLTPVLSYQSAFTDLPIDLSAAPREVSRTPSPVESFNLNQLNPDRIFPAQGEINQETNNMSMQSAEQLFRVALFSAATAAVWATLVPFTFRRWRSRHMTILETNRSNLAY